MFGSVLVAHRGEIAVRIVRTLHALGVEAVAAYGDGDRDALHVAVADRAVRLGPASLAESYLDPRRVVDAAVRSGVDAVHPGYGFLSENAALAAAVTGAGLVWIGPPASAIEVMGDKIRAKRAAAAAGVAVVPGLDEPARTDGELVDAAAAAGYPVLIKPSAGGGGKGMRRVDDPADLLAAAASARREALAAFGDDTLFVEHLVERPRHIEIQVLADRYGNVVHLGERECSLQRRHQKIVEEAPSPLVDEAMRSAMGASAVAVARACGYEGAGTVELVVRGDQPDAYYFLEMNTRLQVEHPVTEMVTGLDLVEWQLRIAAGEPLPLAQDDVRLSGHAVEARVNAEDPARGFLPATGTVVGLVEPAGPGIRVDSGVAEGSVVGTVFDPLLAKVVAWAPDRAGALQRLDWALGELSVLGVATNTWFLRQLLRHGDVVAGRLHTGLVEDVAPQLAAVPAAPDSAVLVAAALAHVAAHRPGGDRIDPWDVADGWRVTGRSEMLIPLRLGDTVVDVGVTDVGAADVHGAGAHGAGGGAADAHGTDAHGAGVGVADVHGAGVGVTGRGAGRPGAGRVPVWARVRVPEAVVTASADLAGASLVCDVDGLSARWRVARDGDDLWLGREGYAWRVRTGRGPARVAAAGRGAGGPVLSPMPGVVRDVSVHLGAAVVAGQVLALLEAMKMEYPVVAPVDGTVTELTVAVGDTVALDQVLVVVEARPGGAPGEAAPEAGVPAVGVPAVGVPEAGVAPAEVRAVGVPAVGVTGSGPANAASPAGGVEP